ncbi:type II secretion system protein [Methylomarinum sp. Ch1-1]|uniref:Type II secretion system protein n=1 Tax=Methylomarinum roseum TaxID=3067653 RepID=A0AAU7NYV7_9GAMM|nr:type II secretion system protein [Methylomarinum sp. Ch1-1]MDP4521742.1 type II secretion system protein [Methylomarinum sp. Ch1-1]
MNGSHQQQLEKSMTNRPREAVAAFKQRERQMNIKQMQSAIKRFRAADVSLIEDQKLRARARKLQAKQGGFTLLELLVVITLLATLSTAALVAYEGIGENAQDTANANNILAAESSIRNYRAVENVYPNQWDNLANLDGTIPGTTGTEPLLADATEAFLGQWVTTPAATLAGGTVLEAVGQALAAVGIDELQTLDPTTTYTNPIPNLSWNESAPGVTAGGASELEFDVDDDGVLQDILWDETTQLGSPVALSIVPSGGEIAGVASTCTADGATISTFYDGTTTATDNKTLNLINDALGDDDCHLVMAFGFGKDVPGTTIDSRVAIGQAPTAGTENVNPATNYARYIALFQVGEDGSDGSTADGDITAAEIFPRARLIGVVDPEGRTLDAAIAGANQGA